MDFIKTERVGAVVVLTIDRPKALNALNLQTLSELETTLGALRGDATVRALIVTGAGEKAFVAGADIGEMKAFTTSEALAFSALGHRALATLEALTFPSIAAVNGWALGGGCELALACDLVYASERAKLGLPEVGLGVIPGFGGTQRLPRLIGRARAMELIFTGDPLDAAKAKECGLVLDVLPADKLLDHCKGIAQKIASRGPAAIAQAKRSVIQGSDASLAQAGEIERQAFAVLFGTSDQREGMGAFLEKRTPSFTGA